MSARARTSQSGTEASTVVTVAERLYFVAVAVLALWVGVWGYFIPGDVTRALPFDVPPLHARFLGAVYLSGFAILFLAILSRYWANLHDVPIMVAIWTGGLGLISLLHLDAFPGAKAQTRIWFGAYLVFPLIALVLSRRHRGDPKPDAGRSVPKWAKGYLTAQGVVLVVVSGMLLLFPGTAVGLWPWPITRMLAQIYSAPLLAYGVGSLLLANRRTWQEMRIPVVGILVFAVLVLVASAMHRSLFSSSEVADVAWFVFLGAISASMAVVGARAVGADRPVVPLR